MHHQDRESSTSMRVLRPSAPVHMHPRHGSEWVTEVVHGELCDVLDEANGWCKVVVPGQPSQYHPRGYPGWILQAYLSGKRYSPTWITISPRTFARYQSSASSIALPMGSLLESNTAIAIQGSHGAISVKLLDGTEAQVSESAVAPWKHKALTRDLLLQTAREWQDQPYIWGGTSSVRGADCSGLTHRCYQRIGLQIPRDADQQFLNAPVRCEGTLDGAKPGDLVFFQRPTSPTIDHVGIYLGGGNYLSAARRDFGVTVHPVHRDPFVAWARYLDASVDGDVVR